jgi:hypothetical protein
LDIRLSLFRPPRRCNVRERGRFSLRTYRGSPDS